MSQPLRTLVLAVANDAQTQALQRLAQDNGYLCSGVARTAIEAVALLHLYKPQLLVLDTTLPQLSSGDSLRPLLQTSTTALILLTSDLDLPLCREALDLGAEAVLTTPWTTLQARAIFRTAWRTFERDQLRRKDIETLKDTLETRKLIDRAKGILMTERGIGEPEAYRLLQKMSQDKRVSMKDVCRAVDHLRSIVGTKTKSKTSL